MNTWSQAWCLTHCPLAWLYFVKNLVKFGSGNGLLSDSTHRFNDDQAYGRDICIESGPIKVNFPTRQRLNLGPYYYIDRTQTFHPTVQRGFQTKAALPLAKRFATTVAVETKAPVTDMHSSDNF